MARIILDNSALVPLFLKEAGTEAIQLLFISGDHDFLAPEFLAIELANVIATGVRRERITQAEAARHMADFNDLGISLMHFPSASNLHHVLEIAVDTGLSFYDAIYLALAKKEGAQLATHDRKLKKIAADSGVELVSF